MKIKMSKNQWLSIGKKARWVVAWNMLSDEQSRIFTQILQSTGAPIEHGHTISEDSAEMQIEDPLWGAAWIQVHKAGDKADTIYVERYYDDERAQDEVGATKEIAINWDNPEETIMAVNSAINEFKENS